MKKILIILIIAISFTRCSDFLDEDLQTDFSPDNYYTKPEHAETAVNAIYPWMRSFTNGSGTFGASPFMMLEFITGKAETEIGQNIYNFNLQELTHDSNLEYGNVWWRSCYSGIGSANLALKYVPEINMDENRKKLLLGEARFLRAFYYFHLVRIFGDVPLIVEPTESLDNILTEVSPVKSIYDEVIVPDLLEAENSGLPATSPEGRVSMGAVKSLLSKVYLTMAGYPLQENDKYALAAAKAKEVIDMNTYGLFTGYDDLRNPDSDNGVEHIFMTQYALGIAETAVPNWLLPNFRGISLYTDEFGSMFSTPAFYNSFEDGDMRKEERQFFYTWFPGHPSDWEAGQVPDSINLGNFYIYKFFDEEAILNTARSEKNWPIFRYAEVLLIYAEAQNEADGSPNGLAYNALNEIRNRAFGPSGELSGLSQTQFREAVWRERYHELCFENKMWYDMIRTRKVMDDNNGQFVDLLGYTNFFGAVYQEEDLLFSIPQRELDNNPNL